MSPNKKILILFDSFESNKTFIRSNKPLRLFNTSCNGRMYDGNVAKGQKTKVLVLSHFENDRQDYLNSTTSL